MKDAEDEAFDELAKRQGHWGGGYQAKKAMAANKLQEPVADRLERLLWEYIDLQAAHPEHRPNPKTWHHLMIYAPLPAQPAQEPVAFICQGNLYMIEDVDKYCTAPHIPLYTHPPRREWVGLTDEELADCLDMSIQKTCRAIEAKLKEKNS
jgi:hypothetical protein